MTVENQYKLPKKSKVEYFIKDVSLANWLKKDVNNMIGMPESFGSREKDIIKGIYFRIPKSIFIIHKFC